jgi:hypothetical protein
MENVPKTQPTGCYSSTSSAVVAPTSEEFPHLSAEMLASVTQQALHAIPRTFPGDSLYDTDVLEYYEALASAGHNQCPSGKAAVCTALSALGMSATRLSVIAENFETIVKDFGLSTVDEVWDLYPPELLMFWSLQSIEDKAWLAAGEQYDQGDAPDARCYGHQEGGHPGEGPRAGGHHHHQGSSPESGRNGNRGGTEKAGGAGDGDREDGGKKSSPWKGGKASTKFRRDTRHGRFPQSSERFFTNAAAYLKADSDYAEWDFTSVEYPELERDGMAQDMAKAMAKAQEKDDAPEEDGEPGWDVMWNAETRTVYHGLPLSEYPTLIEDGHWRFLRCRRKGELAPRPAVYFSTNKAFAMFFAAFKAGLSPDCIKTSKGVVVETPLPPCRYSLIKTEFQEEFAELNGGRRVVRPFPRTEVIISGFRKSWRHKYKDSKLGEILDLSHQIAVIIRDDQPAMESIINRMPSKVAIVGRLLAPGSEEIAADVKGLSIGAGEADS